MAKSQYDFIKTIAVVAVAAVVVLIAVRKKKKKTALADGTDNTAEV